MHTCTIPHVNGTAHPSIDPHHLANRLLERLSLHTARVAVIGLGYVGLPLAETFAAAGFPVLGFDVDPHKVRLLQAGQSYIGHITSQRVSELIHSGHFEATCDPHRLADADTIVICVPTPLTEAREPDLSCITNTAETIRPHLRAGQLVVLESTTYPGTTDEVLRPILEASGLRAGRDFFLAYSPEREDPGNAAYSTRTIPKVVGGINEVSLRLAVALYKPAVSGVVPVSSLGVAEACKILENTYRCVNIALVNELKEVFAAMGIDIWEVIAAAKTKPFGFQAFYPGPGLGGHCIPIDPFYLTWAARRYGIHTKFIELAGEVNTAMPARVVERVAEALNDQGKAVKGSRICVLGVAYKRDVDDVRESPALEILERLRERGAEISYHDPHIPELTGGRRHSLRLRSEELTEAFVAGRDCLLIVTDHSAYDYGWLVRTAPLVVDTRNATGSVAAPAGKVWRA